MSRLILTRGLPGSGKSTAAKEWVAEDPARRVRVNRDDIRATLGITTGVGSKPQEDAVTVLERGQVVAALKADLDVIVDATNLNPQFVKQWFKLHPAVEFMDFPTPIEACIHRDVIRSIENRNARLVGEAVIRRIAKRARVAEGGTLPPAPKQAAPFVFRSAPAKSWDKRDAIIVDIDGTLANHRPHRGPYDTAKYGLDTIHLDVRRVVNALRMMGLEMLITSGRDGDFYDVTHEWLRANGVEFDSLYMRAPGDKRNDAIVKHDLYHERIAPHWNVVMVFDDRDRVVKMWRKIGLTVAQVAEGDF